ncbi:MAG: HAD family phosphatase [Leptolyngbyaceae cyanobacterium T60_A2020_046]|nr:HAD family phosphatase [Leptolyngbyaceae cyanobacterium T60_A2020_046]
MAAFELPKAFIFDMDGLIFDSELLYFEACQRAAAQLGYTVDQSLFLQLVGRSNDSAEAFFLEVFGATFPVHQFDRLWDAEWHGLFNTKGIAFKPGLLSLLDWLEHHTIPKAVGTSSRQEEAHQCLKATGIFERFSTVVTVDQVSAGKPAPDIFLEAARRLNIAPQDCLVLEDSNAGVMAAQAAGMSVVMVPDLQSPTPQSRAIARQIFPSLIEVHQWLETAISPSPSSP